MLASELIDSLQKAMEIHGDMEIIVEHGGDGSTQLCDSVSFYPSGMFPDTKEDAETLWVAVFTWEF